MPPLDTSRPVILLGAEHPRSLAMIRSLGRAGVTVIAVDRFKYAPGLYSRHVSRTHLLDTDDAEETVSFLESLPGADRTILVPTNDHYLRLVSTNHARLAARFTVATQTWDILAPVLDKSDLFRLAATIPVATPVFYVPRSAAELDGILSGLDFQDRRYIFSIPPTRAVPADLMNVRYTVPAGTDLTAARAIAAALTSRCGGPPMVQEMVPGDAGQCLSVVLLADQTHQVIGSRVARRLKLYPYFRFDEHDYGGNVHCVSVHDEEAVAAASALIARTRLSGLVTVEFRRRAGGELVLMKIDPRVVGMVGLCSALDFDVPTLLYRQITGQAIDVSASYEDGRSWIWEKPYAAGMLMSRRGAWREVPGTLTAFRRAASLGIWHRSDPMPFIWNAAGGVRTQVRKRFERQSAKQTSSAAAPAASKAAV